MGRVLFILSSFDRHLSHVHLGVVMNNATANLHGQVFACTNVSDSFGYKASGVAGSYGSSVELFQELGLSVLKVGKSQGN